MKLNLLEEHIIKHHLLLYNWLSIELQYLGFQPIYGEESGGVSLLKILIGCQFEWILEQDFGENDQFGDGQESSRTHARARSKSDGLSWSRMISGRVLIVVTGIVARL